MRGHRNGRVPIEAIFHLARGQRERHGRVRLYVARLAFILIELGDQALITASVNMLGILPVERDVRAFATAHRIPILPTDAWPGDAAGNADAGVVLLTAVDPIRKAVVGIDAIELGRGLILSGRPGNTAVE